MAAILAGIFRDLQNRLKRFIESVRLALSVMATGDTGDETSAGSQFAGGRPLS